MRDVVDENSHVSLPETMLLEVSGQGNSLVKGKLHGRFSRRGFNVTNRTRPSACCRNQTVVTASWRPFGPARLPSTRRNSPCSLTPSDAAPDGVNEHGEFLRVDGSLAGPNGRQLAVTTVWFRQHADGRVRFVTLKPRREKRP